MRSLLFLISIVLSVSAHAGIGSVTESSGTTVIKRGKGTVTVAKGTVVEMNDRVETKNGKTKITFADNTMVTVTESSSLLIDDFVYDPKSGTGKLGLKATGGTVRYVSGNIANNNPNSVKINTPTASIAVRGTDFVMSVSETGSSMIILMPTCETEQNVNLKGLSCGSGKIDVDSGGTRITLDRPYQATIVETQGQPPSPPIVVNLDGRPIGNNLMLSPPTTGTGASIVAAAKSAADKTGDRMPQTTAASEAQQSSQRMSDQAKAQRDDTIRAAINAAELSNKLVETGIKITDISNNEYVYKIWKDRGETIQTGWGYERLSPSGYNYVNISLTMDAKALIVVTQDMVTDAYNSNMMSSKSYGTIVINQQYR